MERQVENLRNKANSGYIGKKKSKLGDKAQNKSKRSKHQIQLTSSRLCTLWAHSRSTRWGYSCPTLRGCRSSLGSCSCSSRRRSTRGLTQCTGSACRTCLLTLKPTTQTRRVEDMRTRQEFAAAVSSHFFATDDADVVNCSQLLISGIRPIQEAQNQ